MTSTQPIRDCSLMLDLIRDAAIGIYAQAGIKAAACPSPSGVALNVRPVSEPKGAGLLICTHTIAGMDDTKLAEWGQVILRNLRRSLQATDPMAEIDAMIARSLAAHVAAA